MPNLSVQEVEDLIDILLSTLDMQDIELFLGLATGDDLYQEYVGRGQPDRKVLRTLVTALSKEGTLTLFLRVVYQRRHEHRLDVRDYLHQHFPDAATPPMEGPVLDVQAAGRPIDGASTNAAAPGLQRHVRPMLGEFDALVWLDRLAKVQQRVCRIETDNRALGTGFLVGADLVLTNWHVVQRLVPANMTDDLSCRFDYAVHPDGGRVQGEVVDVAPKGIIAWSKCSDAELTNKPDQPPPTAAELDFALLRLSDPAGTKRGWIELAPDPPKLEANGPLLIVQHPDGAPVKVAMDTQSIIGEAFGGLRLRYRTNTNPGSSGSPCFTMDWQLVALHHLGEPGSAPPMYNQGVPINLIRDCLVANGHGALIGK